jgi:hypothetical protein
METPLVSEPIPSHCGWLVTTWLDAAGCTGSELKDLSLNTESIHSLYLAAVASHTEQAAHPIHSTH